MADKAKRVEPVNPKEKTSGINVAASEKGHKNVVCYWNGASYSVGATICDNGSLLRCEPDGTWSTVGTC